MPFKTIGGNPPTKSCYGSKLSDFWARDLLKDDNNQRLSLLKQIIILYTKLLKLLKLKAKQSL